MSFRSSLCSQAFDELRQLALQWYCRSLFSLPLAYLIFMVYSSFSSRLVWQGDQRSSPGWKLLTAVYSSSENTEPLHLCNYPRAYEDTVADESLPYRPIGLRLVESYAYGFGERTQSTGRTDSAPRMWYVQHIPSFVTSSVFPISWHIEYLSTPFTQVSCIFSSNSRPPKASYELYGAVIVTL